MRAAILFRIASIFFILFAAGHTYGFLHFKPPTAEGLAAQEAMNGVSFPIGGSAYTLGGFYVGFGLYVTAYLLFSAVLAWQLGGLAPLYPRAILGIAWTLFAVQLASFALSLRYFSMPPAVLSAMVAICLGWAAWQVGRITSP